MVMKVILLPEQYIAFSSLAYVNFPNNGVGESIGNMVPDDDVKNPYVVKDTYGVKKQLGKRKEYETKKIQTWLNTLKDWKLIAHKRTSTGFSGSAFQYPDTGEIIFAFRGTESKHPNDLWTDGLIATARISELVKQFDDAYDFVKTTIGAQFKPKLTFNNTQLSNYIQQGGNISFTGHSLGGGLSQYLSYTTGGKAVTFNGVGIGQNLNIKSYANYPVTDYVNADDIIGNYGKQLGKTIYLKGSYHNGSMAGVNLSSFPSDLADINKYVASMNQKNQEYLLYQLRFNAHGLETLLKTSIMGGSTVTTLNDREKSNKSHVELLTDAFYKLASKVPLDKIFTELKKATNNLVIPVPLPPFLRSSVEGVKTESIQTKVLGPLSSSTQTTVVQQIPDAPRAIVEVAGVDVKWSDIISLKVENTLYMAADSFEATFDNSRLLSDWFRKEQEVKIYMGYVKDPVHWTKSELTHVFTGKIDGVKPSFSNPNVVHLIGRDYSARMIDTEYSIVFKNQKSGQIAKLLADKYKLKFVGNTGDSTLDKEIFHDRKEWDILQTLADREGFVCYVDKLKQLYFGERKESDEKSTYTFDRTKGRENCRVDFDDSSVGVLTKVTVRHWHKKKLIQASAENKELAKRIGQVKERIVYDSKAITPALAKQIADKKLKEWSRNTVTGAVTTSLLPTLFAEKKVSLVGCGRFSGLYYCDQVTHAFDHSGAITDIDITNIRPDTAEQYRNDLYNYNEKKM